MRWKAKGRNQRMDPGAMARMGRERLKARAALFAFASRYPGALAAHFLAGVRQKQRGAAGMLGRTKDLRDVAVTDWLANGHNAGLTEVRDVREVQAIGP